MYTATARLHPTIGPSSKTLIRSSRFGSLVWRNGRNKLINMTKKMWWQWQNSYWANSNRLRFLTAFFTRLSKSGLHMIAISSRRLTMIESLTEIRATKLTELKSKRHLITRLPSSRANSILLAGRPQFSNKICMSPVKMRIMIKTKRSAPGQ